MAKRPAKASSKSRRPVPADDDPSDGGPPGWIAGYPPWVANSFLTACGAKNREDAIQLLRAKRAIDDGNVGDFKRLLATGLDPNSRFPPEERTLLYSAIFRRPNEKICELLLDA